MNPIFLTLRAIGSEFARRIYQPIVIIFACIAVVLIGVSIWLTTISGWWWILLAIILFFTLVISAILVAAWILLRNIRPSQSKAQSSQVKALVDKIQTVADVAGTPKFVILFQIVKDIVVKNQNGYIRRISSDTLSMQQDFQALRESFK